MILAEPSDLAVEVSGVTKTYGSLVAVDEEQTGPFAFAQPVPQGAAEVVFTITLTEGVGPSKPVTLEMPQ